MEIDDLPTLRNEFLRRVGRNLWCYQQVESQLKALLTFGQGALPLRDIAGAATEHAARVRTRTMGQLIDDAVSGVLGSDTPAKDVPIDWLAWSVRFDGGAGFSVDLQARLYVVLAERNALVHHAVGRWSLDCATQLQDGLVELDLQRDRVEDVHERLRHVAIRVRDAAQGMLAYLESKEFTTLLHEKHLEACLVDAVVRAARADGWTSLSVAGQMFREHVERLPASQRERLPKLSDLLAKSGLFEMREEPSANGVRNVCRLRHDADVDGVQR